MAGLEFKPTEFTGNHDAVLPLLGHQKLLAIPLWSPPHPVLSFLQRARPHLQPRTGVGSSGGGWWYSGEGQARLRLASWFCLSLGGGFGCLSFEMGKTSLGSQGNMRIK